MLGHGLLPSSAPGAAQHCLLVDLQCPTIRFILRGSAPLLAARHIEVVLPRLTGLCEHLKEPLLVQLLVLRGFLIASQEVVKAGFLILL